MLMMLMQLIIQLVFGLVMLAIRVALAIAYLFGALLGALLGTAWNAWRRRRAMAVPLRSPEIIEDRGAVPPSPPPRPPRESFTPRALRPRPRR